MTATVFLDDLKSRGMDVKVTATGGLAVRPRAPFTEADCATMAALKPEIVAILTGTPLIGYSRTLGERVRIVEVLDEPPPIPHKDGILTYTRAELERMKGLPPEAVRAIHACKRLSGGVYNAPAAPSATSATLPTGTHVEALVGGEWFPATVVSVWDDDNGVDVYTVPERRGFVEVVRDDATVAPSGERAYTLVSPSDVRALPQDTATDRVRVLGVAARGSSNEADAEASHRPEFPAQGAGSVEADSGDGSPVVEQATPSSADPIPDDNAGPPDAAARPRDDDDLLAGVLGDDDLAATTAEGGYSVIRCQREPNGDYQEVDETGQTYLVPPVVDQAAMEAAERAELARQWKCHRDALMR